MGKWLERLQQLDETNQRRRMPTPAPAIVDPEEVAWRVAALRTVIPDRGPIWPPKIRQTPLTDTPGHCSLCGDELHAMTPWRRCSPCVRALWLALNTAREGVTLEAM